MTVELQYLAWVTALTLLMRVPWMINKVMARGLGTVTGYPLNPQPLDGWGHRVWVAHEDAVDNLVVFGTLVIVLHLVGGNNVWTHGAAAIYFWSRLVHFLAYCFAIPRVKTVAFIFSFTAQVVLAWQLVLFGIM